MKSLRLFPALLLVLTASCQKEQTNDVLNTQGLTISSRTTAMNGETASPAVWQDGDCMGVFFGDEPSAVKFEYNGESWSTATTSVSASSTIAAYTPWSENSDRNSVTILDDQSSVENIRKSDFLYAEGTNATIENNALNLTFDHRLSQLIVNYTYTGGLDAVNAPTNVKVLNQPLTYSKTDNTWGVSGNTNSEITPLVNHKSGNDGSTGTIEAILVPHTVESGTEFMTFTINGIPYTVSASKDKNWLFGPGENTTINLSISPDNAQILDVKCSAEWQVTEASGSLTEISAGYEYDEQSNTYYIYNAKGLQYWRGKAAVKNDTELVCANAKLMNNIDMTDVAWPSCCRGESGLAYNGTFDGNGFTISNLTANADWSAVGFIASLGTGTIKNLTIDGVKVSTDADRNNCRMGGIVGEITDAAGTVDNCHVKLRKDSRIICRRTDAADSSQQGTMLAGGITGESQGTIKNCTVKAVEALVPESGRTYGYNNTSDDYHIQSITYGGGIVGRHYNTDIVNCHVDGVRMYGTTSAGIVAEANIVVNGTSSVIACSANDLYIRAFDSSNTPGGSLRGAGMVGRINIGKDASTGIFHLAGSYSMNADIQLDNTTGSEAAGLIAKKQGGELYITSCYAASKSLVAKTATTIVANGDQRFKQVGAQKMDGITHQGTPLDNIATIAYSDVDYNASLQNPNRDNLVVGAINWKYVRSDNKPFPMVIQPKN